jgi:hypothetical protein
MRSSIRSALLVALFSSVIAAGSLGCDKLKSMASGGSGASASASAAPDTPAGQALALLDGFEGEIDVSAKGDKPGEAPMPLAVLVKSGKIRMDIPEQLARSGGGPMGANAKGYGIFDSAAKKIYVVLDSSKQVIVVDLNKIGEEMKGFAPPGKGSAPGSSGGPQGTPPKVTKTGKYDTVAGYKCENWDVSSDHKEGTVCVAQEGFSWLSLPMAALNGVPTEHLWMAELLDGKHFPLRFVGYGQDGTTEKGRVEVTKVDKKPLPDASFAYPPTYAVIDLDQMMRGLGGMMGGMPHGGMPGMPPGMPGMPPMPSAHAQH